MCYGPESYCSVNSRTVEPCFPEKLLKTQIDLLAWCSARILEKATSFPHPSCRLTCEHIINSSVTYAPQQNSPSSALPQNDIQVVIAVIISWFVSGIIVANLAMIFLLYRHVSRRTKQAQVRRCLMVQEEQASEIGDRYSISDARHCEQEELLELHLLFAGDSLNIDPEANLKSYRKSDETATEASLKSVSEKSDDTAIEELQVAIEDNELDVRIRNSVGLPRRLPLTEVDRSSVCSEESTSFISSSHEQILVDEVVLPSRSVHDIKIHDEHEVWFD